MMTNELIKMEVHHHSHTPRQKRGHYFWEFFMLFLAVTMGFFVENIREHYVERHRVKQYARSLVHDLAADTNMIRYHINRMKLFIRMTDSLSSYLKGRKLEDINNFEMFALSSIDRYPPYIWSRATIEQIQNSGSLRYFPLDIVRQIAAYSALSHHLDDDFANDEQMGNEAASRRNELIDMDYAADLWMGLRNNIDSVRRTADYQALKSTDQTSLLTNNLNNIKIFLNDRLNMRKHMIIRSDEELTELLDRANQLIAALCKEYKINY
jgi:hypothetical protein